MHACVRACVRVCVCVYVCKTSYIHLVVVRILGNIDLAHHNLISPSANKIKNWIGLIICIRKRKHCYGKDENYIPSTCVVYRRYKNNTDMGRSMQKRVFECMRTVKALISLRICAGWSRPLLLNYRIMGQYNEYQWRANGRYRMRLCACVAWTWIVD